MIAESIVSDDRLHASCLLLFSSSGSSERAECSERNVDEGNKKRGREGQSEEDGKVEGLEDGRERRRKGERAREKVDILFLAAPQKPVPRAHRVREPTEGKAIASSRKGFRGRETQTRMQMMMPCACPFLLH